VIANRAIAAAGGLTTKIHALVDSEGRPVQLHLSEGQASDCKQAKPLLEHLPEDSILLADKACDSNAIRSMVEAAGAFANILQNSLNRASP